MSDPFLDAHAVTRFHYDLGGQLSPISIRDQMVRGQILIDRALEQGLIDQNNRNLLVVGAGAAGATAALHAARQGVQTTLIDSNTIPFSRQSGCLTRWIDPTQYDWPVDHWSAGHYPWVAPGPLRPPLPWRAGRANVIAAAWAQKLNALSLRYPHLTIYYGTEWNPIASLRYGTRVSLRSLKGSPLVPKTPLTFKMVLSSTGFGNENCTVKNYKGFRFWDTDLFEQPNVGVQSTSADVLISGGGDGSLQDFLRIMTTKTSAGDIYRQITAPGTAAVDWAALETRLLCAEDQAQRAFIWGVQPHHDHAIFDRLHLVYEREIFRLQSSPRWSSIAARINALLRNPIPNVTFVYRCSHFSRSYALNKFLVFLLADHLKARYPVPVKLVPGAQVIDVVGTLHTCAHDPKLCHGQDHRVTFEAATCMGSGSHQWWDLFNVVIIRHGVQLPQPVYRKKPMSRPRQLLPYHLP